MDAVGEGTQSLMGKGVGVFCVAVQDGIDVFGQQVIEAVAVVAQIAIELGGRSDRAANAEKLSAVVYIRFFLFCKFAEGLRYGIDFLLSGHQSGYVVSEG